MRCERLLRSTAQGLLVVAALLAQALLPGATNAVTTAQSAQRAEIVGRIPLYFERNLGQADPSVSFLGRGNGYRLNSTARAPR